MQKKYASFAILTAALVLLGAGCSSGSTGPDGGMFVSGDSGATWFPKSALLSTTGASSFASLDVNTFAVDPQDPKALWVGTMANGIMYSADGGESWQQAKSYSPAELQLTQSRINALAVDPANSCVVYGAITNPAGASYTVRTINCGRSWGLLTASEITGQQFSAIAINPKNRLQIFVGNTAGDLFRTDNGGQSWVKLTSVNGKRIRSIAINQNTPNILYVATAQGGLWKSSDAGATWARTDDAKKFRGSDDVYVIAMDSTKADTLLIGTAYGILHSEDGGASWEAYQLLTAPNETQIISLAINPVNPAHIFYGTPKAFYRSVDGGTSWTTKRIPTTRAVKQLYVQNVKGAAGQPDSDLVWFAAWNATK